MKTLLKTWMYLCTFVCTAYIVLIVALLLWAQYHADDNTYTTADGKTIDLAAGRELAPEIDELLRAIETNDMETIYKYAAPEIKDKVSYDLFKRDQWPNTSVEQIEVIYRESSRTRGSDSEYTLLILSFEENGARRYGSMRWRKTADSIYYDTFPFNVTLLGEFSSFPSHMRK